MAKRIANAVKAALPFTMVRSQVLALAMLVLVFAMVVIAVAGFSFISSQQEGLTNLRVETARLRAVNQALTMAETDVSSFALTGRGDLSRYFRALDTIHAAGANAIDPTEDLPQPEQALEALRTDWTSTIGFAAKGQIDAAGSLLTQKDTAGQVANLIAAADATLAARDRNFAEHDQRIRLATWAVLLLQVLSGTLALCGLVYAFRSSATESAGRAAALASADASREQVARLFEMADVLQSAADYSDANAVLKATAAELVEGFSGALYVFNNSRDRLVLSTAWERDELGPLPETITPAECWALKRGKPHVNRDDGGKLCCAHHHTAEAVLEIPMIARGEILGLLQLFASGADAEQRLQRVTGMGSALADGMSLALANMGLREKLRNQALRDPLTGLYNRRYMEDTLQRFLRLAEREHREVSVIMVDLDHFKRLNDEHGHAFGDSVLRESAMTLVGSLRETDVVCRYGGEEMVVIMPDCPFDRAVDKAEVLRQRIEELSAKLGADVTASFGVAALPHAASNIADLMQSADAALYKSKQNGRNQVSKAPVRTYRGPDRPEDTAEEFVRQAAE